MIDLRKLYIELIKDYDPYCDISEHETLPEHEMLYNLIEIKENNGIENIDNEDEQYMYNRFIELIELFKASGINPYY